MVYTRYRQLRQGVSRRSLRIKEVMPDAYNFVVDLEAPHLAERNSSNP